ncbi:hypothetical protein VOWphi5012_100 [Vibrio phage phi50-12]|uniref:Uncharacterized protein n=1 Tax=Vibrio phage phi50-12 TaxID=2654972 RepID=A0A5P8PRE9_9CAUD|nr:hypothetical protein KNU82_gp100 [Vibrio phage phi50-12]QFR59884.1 hypothetical protein VOWphi5012_100 [Vibrio phage phi50-12]
MEPIENISSADLETCLKELASTPLLSETFTMHVKFALVKPDTQFQLQVKHELIWMLMIEKGYRAFN